MINTHVITPPEAHDHIRRHRNCYKRGATHESVLLDDYRQIVHWLPPEVDTILDIGCGMAGIDVLLKRHYPEAKLWLLDGDGDDPRDGWLEVRDKAFSSRAIADKLLAANGIVADRWIDIGTQEHLQADLVISRASWGYHYPLSTYNVTGFCIADLRTATEKPRGAIIGHWPKRNRCAWHQKGKT